MSDFAFTFPVQQAIDLRLVLYDGTGNPFDLASYLAGGGVARLHLELATGSMTTKVIDTTIVDASEGSNIATIHLTSEDVLVPGVYSGTFSAGSSWTGRGTVVSQIDAALASAGTVSSTQRLPSFTTATRPAASVEWVAREIYVRDGAADGEVQVCRQTAGGSYEWIVVAY
jgi:hypothetical protein